MRKKCMTRILATKRGPIILGKNLIADLPNAKPETNFHLYILSNDRIEDNDWVFVDLSKNKTGYRGKGVWKFKQAPCPLPYWGNRDCAKKIIACTDEPLQLPLPSITFIEKFLKECSKGHLINVIMVDYEDDGSLKVLAETNTIIIKPVKTIWKLEDVIQLYEEAYRLGSNNTDSVGHCDLDPMYEAIANL